MKWKLRYIEAFNRMENELRHVAASLVIPNDMATRIQKIEADLKALIDLYLGQNEPGFITVRPYRRRIPRKNNAAHPVAQDCMAIAA